MTNLATTYTSQHQLQKAEEPGVEVLGMSLRKLIRVYGKDHPNTVTSVAKLASTFRDQGRLDKAANLQEEMMKTKKKVLGGGRPYHIDEYSKPCDHLAKSGSVE
ncbi:uncharacterized protein A1O9_03487 [Exophiala aquamarina CBS 119918]|uniref:Kinesin light chain n=1 Tax=Exophiala aquamarina CBS 119918 TaxID=1182545 RepID=A0A072Q203_9EURO|nr:uncharacterized protein A1O9_03487 [Exophiala aquamarina CBS 119918]KEF61915.1 hypothetical protein A1O9_03487 [Exophiala aquamarina CBS 119918]